MGDQMSKYHQEKSVGAPASPAADSSNESTLPPHSGGGGSVVNPGNMGNPMIPMSGGKAPAGGETDSKNSMIIGGGGSKAELPSEAQVMAKNPQGHKSAPLAGKLR